MLRSEIEYRKDILWVKIIGSGNINEIELLKTRIDDIMRKYGIRDLYLDFSCANTVDITLFEDLRKRYYVSYHSYDRDSFFEV